MADTHITQLVYMSRAQEDLKDQDIENILQTARDFNSKNNITGLLLFHSGIFLQVLEGDKNTIEELYYKKIRVDNRHTDVTLMLLISGNPRIFEDWSMKYKQLTQINIETINHIVSWNKLINNAEIVDNKLIMQIFEIFKF